MDNAFTPVGSGIAALFQRQATLLLLCKKISLERKKILSSNL